MVIGLAVKLSEWQKSSWMGTFYPFILRIYMLNTTGKMVENCKISYFHNWISDLYLPHRISQSFEMSQFIRHTSKKFYLFLNIKRIYIIFLNLSSDFVVVVGDFNMEPNDLGCHLIKNITQLYDAWESRPVSTTPNVIYFLKIYAEMIQAHHPKDR